MLKDIIKNSLIHMLYLLYYKKRLIVGAFCACVAAFLAVSLFYYSPYDNSFLFYREDNSVANPMGKFGAHVAAFLIYLLGGAAYFSVALLAVVAYMLIFNKSLWHEWDRLLAFGLGAITLSALFSAYAYDMVRCVVPGGLCGLSTWSTISLFFDSISALIMIYGVLCAALIIATRVPFIALYYYGQHVGQFMYAHSYLFKPIYVMGTWLLFIMTYPFARFFTYMKFIIYGSDSQDESIRTCAYEDAEPINEIVEDDFWQEYCTDTPSESEMQKSFLASHMKRDDDNHDVTDNSVHDNPLIERVQKKIPKNSYVMPQSSEIFAQDQTQEDPQFLTELEERAKILEEKLERFGVCGKVIEIKRGPVVTLFEYQPHIDTKISKIIALEDDLALALQALSIRIIAPIPGRSVVGFEVANAKRKSVLFGSVVQSKTFRLYSGALPLVLGCDTVGNDIIVDLAKMPHLLIAGSTGSGKSVALNSMLVSLLCRCKPEQLRLVLIDPKRLEFASYADMAHLLFPIITNPKRAVLALKWVVKEMERRYDFIKDVGARNISDYNAVAENKGLEQLPFIVIIIDELSDLMITAGREIENLIVRITQMARAAGIHMLVATQRPSVDVITGLIKVNFPSRVSFRVTSKVDSRTILDCGGAEKLLGRGDMLFLDAVSSTISRVHGAFVSDKQIEQLVQFIRQQGEPQYIELTEETVGAVDLMEGDDQLYEDIVTFLEGVDEVSISLLQRRFRIGYNRSARIIDMLEMQGFIAPSDGGKMRKVNHEQ